MPHSFLFTLYSSAALNFAGDLTAQYIENNAINHPHQYSMCRTLQFTATGVLFQGVIGWARLSVVERVIPYHHRGLTGALEKTFVNEGVLAPFVRLLSMALIQYLQTASKEDVVGRIRADFVEAQLVGWASKVPLNIIVFVFFPHDKMLQFLAMRAVSFCYGTYFSYVTHRDFKHVEGQQQAQAQAEPGPKIVELDDESDKLGDADPEPITASGAPSRLHTQAQSPKGPQAPEFQRKPAAYKQAAPQGTAGQESPAGFFGFCWRRAANTNEFVPPPKPAPSRRGGLSNAFLSRPTCKR